VTYACALLGIAPSPPVSWDDAVPGMSAMALSFWQDNRRVDNRRIKAELGVALRYPTYREGLAAVARTLGVARQMAEPLAPAGPG